MVHFFVAKLRMIDGHEEVKWRLVFKFRIPKGPKYRSNNPTSPRYTPTAPPSQFSRDCNFSLIFQMASVIARLPPHPAVFINGRRPLFGLSPITTLRTFSEKPVSSTIAAKATSEGSESSTSISFKSIRNVWDKSEDRIALIGLGFAGIVGVWAAINLVAAIDKLPIVPSTLEFIGILFSSWFVYRYLLFKPDREELFRSVNKSISDVLGQ
ncbi:protein CURVATURE THYLAKOID 1C, chloroplastic isoform X1 [Ipomoea triloba]|uniref:protein CURVATURE THYLAKOID 1C, chloroplastic isoform X1 n=2 Tax=Ipomoea triloba TaxID=35885 RepID=UPI00125DC58F|nr:protein CURVATURE THYLAKOID 1C, chloroplastic isoform X1 [Ipomoea triloba]